MSFRVIVDGEEVTEVDEQVTRVTVMTSRGASAVVGIADEGAIELILEKAVPGGPRRLDHLENQLLRNDAARVQGKESGTPTYDVSRGLVTSQGPHTYTVTGDEPEHDEDSGQVPPDRDLAEGLDPSDTATLTARINAFSSSGDAEAAIRDNEPGSGQASTEEPPADEPTEGDLPGTTEGFSTGATEPTNAEDEEYSLR